MIDQGYVAVMARYNLWQNREIYGAAEGIGDAARRQDRGAFFGSIHGTLSHLLWADTIWMSRFDGWQAPAVGIPGSADWGGDWPDMTARRAEADDRILAWADRLRPEELAGELTWFSRATGREETRARAVCIAHVFNHQTHHRGQVHAMLTAAGARPADTDLPLMPE